MLTRLAWFGTLGSTPQPPNLLGYITPRKPILSLLQKG